MPKVDPDSGEMLGDHPDAGDDERGGRIGSDADQGANPTGSDAMTQKGRTPPSESSPSTAD